MTQRKQIKKNTTHRQKRSMKSIVDRLKKDLSTISIAKSNRNLKDILNDCQAFDAYCQREYRTIGIGCGERTNTNENIPLRTMCTRSLKLKNSNDNRTDAKTNTDKMSNGVIGTAIKSIPRKLRLCLPSQSNSEI